MSLIRSLTSSSISEKGRGVIPAPNERRNDGRAVTLPDCCERRHWRSQSDWCSVELRCRMQIDERLPVAVVVEEEWRLQRSRLGEVGVLRCRIDEVPVGVTSACLSEPEDVIRSLLGLCQEDGSEEWSSVMFRLALPPCDEQVLVRLVVEQLRPDALLGIRVDGLGGLVDLEVSVELLASECELKEAVGIERVRSDLNTSVAVTIKERNRTSVAVSSDERMHDDFGESLRVLKSRWWNCLKSRTVWERRLGSMHCAISLSSELVPVDRPADSLRCGKGSNKPTFRERLQSLTYAAIIEKPLAGKCFAHFEDQRCCCGSAR